MVFRRAFTLLELIIVIVLLGIVGVMSTDIVSQTYRNYVYQKEVADLQSRSKQLVDQITQYLERSIKPSVARLDGVNHASVWDIGLSDANQSNNAYLEWIGKDLESQRGEWNGTMVYPGYSGLANVRDSNGTNVITTDCNLSLIDPIQNRLTGETLIMAGVNRYRTALYFVYANSDGTVEQRFWVNPTSLFGITGLDSPVKGVIQLAFAPPEIGELYYLAYSAYAIQLENDGTLQLYQNFRPWNGEVIDQIRIDPLVLMENVTSFEYWSESQGTMLRFKVCLRGDDAQVRVCKEGVVLR